MADDKAETREVTWRTLLPWTELFRGFQIALDLNKLLLAAAGIVLTFGGWWLLAWVFGAVASYKDTPPAWNPPAEPSAVNQEWRKFKDEREDWNLMHRAAGVGSPDVKYENIDFADSPDELERINKDGMAAVKPRFAHLIGKTEPDGLMATAPWNEDRGPNPFLLATAQTTRPWEQGRFWEWFATDQAPVLVEPLVKFLRPIVFFFHPHASATARFYFLCVMLWTLIVWSLFGGAITRIAAVQIARNERIGMSEAVRFTMKRLAYYITAPLFPLLFVFGLLVIMVIFGFLFMIPGLGDIVFAGLGWWVMMGFGLLMAVALVGLVGWPLMAATISTEGTDSWEAVSRSYTYVFQKPWHYCWYGLVSVCYGAVVVFFIGFMGSFMVYLSKWGVSQTPFMKTANREPTFLFVYAPQSFGWRTLLLQGATVNDQKVVQDGGINHEVYERYLGHDEKYNATDPKDILSWWNKAGAVMVAFWVGLLFLLVLGFGYSFFWSSATIIYMLMRKKVDTAEMDEVYLEEDDQEGAYSGPLTPPAPAPVAAVKTTPGLQMVDAPSLKTPEPTAMPPSPNGGITETPPP